MNRRSVSFIPAASLAFGLILVGLLLWVVPASASSLTVYGEIRDSDGEPLPDIRVEVYDDDFLVEDDFMGFTYTGPSGNYSVSFSDPSLWWDRGYDLEPDVYIKVEWKFRLIPEYDFNHHHVRLLCKYAPLAVVFEPKDTRDDLRENVDPFGSVSIDLQMDQELDNVGSLRLHINEALTYFLINRDDVPWQLTYDINASVKLNATESAFFAADELEPECLLIGDKDITGTQGGHVSDIYHELAHYVKYKL